MHRQSIEMLMKHLESLDVKIDDKDEIAQTEEIARDGEFWAIIWWGKLHRYMHGKKGSQLAKKMDVSRQRFSTMVKEEAKLQMDTLINLSLACDMVPHLVLEPIGAYAMRSLNNWPMVTSPSGYVYDCREFIHDAYQDEALAYTAFANTEDQVFLVKGSMQLPSAIGLKSSTMSGLFLHAAAHG